MNQRIKTTPSPLVSVVIPCYNQIQFLKECLNSLVAQTMHDWETIVIDDASTDADSSEILKAINDSRITLIHHTENRGLAAARNTGIRYSRGQFLLPVDADDKLAPDYLEKVLPLLLNQSQNNCAFPDFYAFGAFERHMSFNVQDTSAFLKRQWLPGSGTLFTKSLWEQVGGYCEADEFRYGNEDWDFWLGAVEIGLNAAHIAKPLYYYRQHKHSMVTRLRYYDYVTREAMYRRHQCLFDQYDMGAAFRTEGYHRSARASWGRGERLRAAWLALRGVILMPHHRQLAKLGLQALYLGPLISLISKGKRLVSGCQKRIKRFS